MYNKEIKRIVMQEHYIILIDEAQNKKKYAYSNASFAKNDLPQTFQNIYNTLKSSNNKLQLQLYEDTPTADVYEDVSVVSKGWVWNGTSTKRDVKYVLSVIPLLSRDGLVDISTQTLDKNTKANDTINNDLTDSGESDSDSEFETPNRYAILSNYGGYANSFLFPHGLIDELSSAFKRDNFGLRKAVV